MVATEEGGSWPCNYSTLYSYVPLSPHVKAATIATLPSGIVNISTGERMVVALHEDGNLGRAVDLVITGSLTDAPHEYIRCIMSPQSINQSINQSVSQSQDEHKDTWRKSCSRQ